MGIVWNRDPDEHLITPEEPHSVLIAIGVNDIPERILPDRVLAETFGERWQDIQLGRDKEFVSYPYNR